MKNDESSLQWALNGLERSGKRLTNISNILLSSTCVQVMLLVTYLADMTVLGRDFYVVASVSITTFVFFAAIFFDSARKHGKTFFDEVSGSLHGDVSQLKEDSDSDTLVKTRVRIRQYLNTTEIPLLPGKYGPGILVLFNLMVLALILFLARSRFM